MSIADPQFVHLGEMKSRVLDKQPMVRSRAKRRLLKTAVDEVIMLDPVRT